MTSDTFPFTPVEKQFQLPSIATIGLGADLPSEYSKDNIPALNKGQPRKRPSRGSQSEDEKGLINAGVGNEVKGQRPANKLTPSLSLNQIKSRTTSRKLQPLENSSPVPVFSISLGDDLDLGKDTGAGDDTQQAGSDAKALVPPPGIQKPPKKGTSLRKSRSTPRQIGASTGNRTDFRSHLSPVSSPTARRRARDGIKSALPKIGTFDRVLTGFLDSLPRQRFARVRIFLSSTFSDFKVERNALCSLAYPRLKRHCADLGLDFQVVDLRWGIYCESINDHSVNEICLQEIKLCQKLSRGPNFVAMIGDRYGAKSALCPVVDAAEFELLRRMAADLDLQGQTQLDAWYKRDNNAVPPEYILQPINSRLPDYINVAPGNEDKQSEAARQWASDKDALQRALQRAATEAVTRGEMTEERRHFFYQSVTELEIQAGIFDLERPGRACHSFQRHLQGIEENLTDPLIHKFLDVSEDDAASRRVDEDLTQLLGDLRDSTIPKYLAKENISKYTVPWQNGGLDPQDGGAHEQYLKTFCDDFVSKLTSQLDTCLKEEEKEVFRESRVATSVTAMTRSRSKSQDRGNVIGGGQMPFSSSFGSVRETDLPFSSSFGSVRETDLLLGQMSLQQVIAAHEVIEVDDKTDSRSIADDRARQDLQCEILHHLSLCRQKCDLFCGRQAELLQVKKILQNRHQMARPIVVHGDPGAGKTSFIAMVTRMSKQWLGEECVTVVRFLGTSAYSVTIRKVMISIYRQICCAYGFELRAQQLTTLAKVLKCLQHVVVFASLKFAAQRPLVIILDAVHQLQPVGGAHTLSWLPHILPHGVHYIISMRSSPSDLLERSKLILGQDASQYLVGMSRMTPGLLQTYAEKYLATRRRTLTRDQMERLSREFAKQSDPLRIQLILDRACAWHSYTDISGTDLPATTRDCIWSLFDTLERKFGQLLVGCALSYLTLGRRGLTEVELEDVLSCNDRVLDEVYKYHNPPVEGAVRIPELLWARLQHDLRGYVSDQQAQGRSTLYWREQPFADVARDKYFPDVTTRRQFHRDLVEIFTNESTVRRTVSLSQRSLIIEDADRLVTPQPLTSQNRRKLVCLPFHLYKSGDHRQLTETFFCNLRFLQCYIEAFSVYELLPVMTSYAHKSEHAPEVSLVHQCLRYADQVIQADLSQLPVQILTQLLKYCDVYPAIATLCDEAGQAMLSSGATCLLPRTGSLPSSSSAMRWYTNGPTHIAASDDRAATLILGVSSVAGKKACYRAFNAESLEQGRTLFRVKDDSDLPLQCFVSSGSPLRAYFLFPDHVQIYSAFSGQIQGRVATHKGGGRGAGGAARCMAVSEDGGRLALASRSRLFIYHAKANAPSSESEINYQPGAAMNLSGVSDTTNLVFSHDGHMTISSHSIEGKKQHVGAVVLWSHADQELRTRVALAAPVYRHFLYRARPLAGHDLVVCGCHSGQIFILDMALGKVVAELGHVRSASAGRDMHTLTSFNATHNVLAVGVKGQPSVTVWSVDLSVAGELGELALGSALSALGLSADAKHLTVGTDDGDITVFQLGDNTKVRSVHAHMDSVTSTLASISDVIVTCGGERLLKLWDAEALTEVESEDLQDNVMTGTAALTDGKPLLEDEHVFAYDVSPNGDTLITGSRAGAKIWRRTSSQQLQFQTSLLAGAACYKVAMATRRLVGYALSRQESGDKCLKTFNAFSMESQKQVTVTETRTDVADFYLGRDSDEIWILQWESEKRAWSVICLDPGDHKVKMAVSFTLNSPDSGGVNLRLPHVAGQHAFVMSKYGAKKCFPREHLLHSVDLASGDVTTCQYSDVTTRGKQVDKLTFTVHSYRDQGLLLGCHGDALLWSAANGHCRLAGGEDLPATWLRHSLRYYWKQGKCKEDTEKTPITALAVSRDASVVATGADNGSVIVWIKSDGIILKGHTATVTGLALDDQVALLVSGARDRTVKLWHITNRTLLHSVNLHMYVRDLSFTASQEHVIARCSETDLCRIFVFDLVGRSQVFVTQ